MKVAGALNLRPYILLCFIVATIAVLYLAFRPAVESTQRLRAAPALAVATEHLATAQHASLDGPQCENTTVTYPSWPSNFTPGVNAALIIGAHDALNSCPHLSPDLSGSPTHTCKSMPSMAFLPLLWQGGYRGHVGANRACC